jgi:hypothetical protein
MTVAGPGGRGRRMPRAAGVAAGRQGTSGRMTPNLGELQEYLAGLDYPVSKEDLLRWAQENGASTQIMQLLRSLPADYFTSPSEISTAVAEMA